MAKRPVFLPSREAPYWRSIDVDFEWHSGFAISQRRKSIDSLHRSALATGEASKVLEVSSRSQEVVGMMLSAFSLRIAHPDHGRMSLESGFQGSKVFSSTGQLTAAYKLDARDAKSLAREVNSHESLVGFRWGSFEWSLEPKSWFYDWLYIKAVLESDNSLTGLIRQFDGFTDIEFNPDKSFNCQARSCAIIASTSNDEELIQLIVNPRSMVERGVGVTSDRYSQSSLF